METVTTSKLVIPEHGQTHEISFKQAQSFTVKKC